MEEDEIIAGQNRLFGGRIMFLVPLLISLLLIVFGMIFNLLFKSANAKSLYAMVAVPILFETLGIGILQIINRREKIRKRSVISSEYSVMGYRAIANVDNFIAFIGVLMIIYALVSVTSFLGVLRDFTSTTLLTIFLGNEIFCLLAGLSLIINIYLGGKPKKYFSPFTSSNLQDLEVGVTNRNEDNPAGIAAIKDLIVEQKRVGEITNNTLEEKMNAQIDSLIGRLIEENYNMQSQARVNLIIGILIAIGGVIALLIIIQINAKIPPDDLLAKFNYFSRLTLVIFIEVLALFFLRLYKENLNDKKYYQNELTNIEMKCAALVIASMKSNPKDISKVIDQFLATERNFKLGKNESTVSIKQIELENSFIRELFSKKEVIPARKGKNSGE